MTLRIVPAENPSREDRDAILAPLQDYNLRHGGDPNVHPVALLLQDEQGNSVGGLWGRCAYDWLFVEYLAIPDAYRGQDHGTALMQHAEAIARERGCLGLWLDTFSFQARGFYEKLGFTLFGTLEDHPAGQARHFLCKRF